MKKTLCALAVGATLFTPALAMAADVKVYGRAHVSLDYLDNGADYNEVTLSSNSSRLGFKAEQKLENGLTVFGQIEQEVNFASGAKDEDDGVDFATRDTFVGLKGDFGQARVGRFDSPFKAARGPVNFFGDQLGDIRNVTRVGNLRFDERNANTIEYKSPKLGGGFNVIGAVSLHGETEVASDEKSKAYDLALTYKEGPVDFAAAYEHYEEDADKKERDGFRVAAAYKITPEFNLGALYQYLTHDDDVANPDAQVFGVAADYKFAPKTYLRGQVFHRDVDADDANATLLAVGVEHRLDKAVRVYANLATVLNDENSKLTPWSAGRSTKTSDITGGANGEDAFGLSLGFRYDF
ncbi:MULTISPECIES: porin [Acinetobacter]|uniref:Porin n=1 Tax=Acinetobacter indicus TaxID=756892 RepID=A0A7S6VSR6_9GAMM|nr:MULTISPECIES: porin [Acinetobacter]MCO8109165.1 porin [Acinetobacter indicus]MDM1771524.1 porin [Acinetobacter indicus]MDM1774274.1 porin [Acinetobacter indicus]QIC76203.1 porin [Acinetobacter indicus]QOW44083.1 porin [Acinetobacter indicus]